MGTSESKMAVESTTKPELIQRLKNQRLAHLADPRSPSCEINRTPIQVNGVASTIQEVQESVGPVFVDPRSPTVGVARTPLKDSMKVTVTSLARRLSTFFLNDVMVGDSVPTPPPPVSFMEHHSLPNVEQKEELSSNEPLLPPHSYDSLNGPIKCPSTPKDFSSSRGYVSFCSSPFVVVSEAQLEVGADADTTIDEAEEAVLMAGSPLKRELSLSMLGCREGVYSPEFFPSAEERPCTPLPPLEDRQDVNHSSAQPCINCDPIQSAPVPVQEAILPPSTTDLPQSPEQEVVVEKTAILPEQVLKQPEKPVFANSEPNKSEVLVHGITFPRFDTRSPSQAVFKPQWLGVGFGVSGVRARGVQNRGRGPSSPLSTRRPATDENENKVVVNKQKQRGNLQTCKTLIGEGRSPLQILKETNSPRKNSAQMKLKVSTPEQQRFGQMDRRALILSLNKEN
ncbi:cell division cycle-associated protein 3 isoform X1 [Tachysurus vachellii]|uniref:cell division cycle-associated protein 3 isoform X1 n=1 Tax=Tachysurus vachellii TaxID=175792 RepID=UPI00296B25AE|nr:cell division cycle-associated protein 3 isoform X1 [Tachysurus vachellii]XP_060726618.1 cell division cycle-associated protein 3 isoform X1 [Tachysurus vachellii]